MEVLKKLRISRGLSQQALAEKFNLTQQSIYKYENGLAEPDIETLKKIAVFFGISVDYLIYESPAPTVEDMLLTLSPTERELRILQKFRGLPSNIQNSVEIIIDELSR